uniref:Uncharacterized protein n=1 Tax=Anguilla anguilla TaxID=7936 RepID=A0A0E9X2Q9_ANGAN
MPLQFCIKDKREIKCFMSFTIHLDQSGTSQGKEHRCFALQNASHLLMEQKKYIQIKRDHISFIFWLLSINNK